MELVITIFLPLALVIIMFSLGLGLTVDDFRRVVMKPKAFAIGAVAQLILIPCIAYVLAVLFRLPPELAVGLMILSFCPGGMTANLLTKIAGGEVALSISLTGIISLIAVFTMPLLAKLSADHFMGLQAGAVDVTSLSINMAMLTLVPAAAGLVMRHISTDLAAKVDKVVSKVAVLFFVAVVVGALATNWRIFTDNMPVLGPVLVLFNLLLLGIGFGMAKLFSLSLAEGKAIAIETGIQNATLGMTVGSLITENASGLPPFSLPSGVYGITMYLVSIPVVLWLRSRRSVEPVAA